jgi:hypothetical protein
MKYSGLGNILITGDLNARVGRDGWDDNYDIPVIEHLGPFERNKDSVLQRSSCDITINKYGRKLKQICQGFDLQIANGRAPGDRLGNYTCYTNKGSSVVDYVICDQSFLKNITKLNILPPEFGSVHTPLSIKIKCSFKTEGIQKKSPIPSPPKFIWDPSKSRLLLDLLTQQEIVDKFDLLKTKLNSDIESFEVDQVIKIVSDTLFDTANKCLKLAKKRKICKKPKKKPWFDNDCARLSHSLKYTI